MGCDVCLRGLHRYQRRGIDGGATVQTFIVGLGYRARHGKDTVSRAMLEQFGGRARQYSFAAPLKAFARILGMREKDGTLLQALGTDVFRRLNPDLWVDIAAETVKEDAPQVAVFTDLRFQNEAQWINFMGGMTVRVNRFALDGRPWIDPTRDSNHQSETELETYPFSRSIQAMSGDVQHLEHEGKRLATLIQGGLA